MRYFQESGVEHFYAKFFYSQLSSPQNYLTPDSDFLSLPKTAPSLMSGSGYGSQWMSE